MKAMRFLLCVVSAGALLTVVLCIAAYLVESETSLWPFNTACWCIIAFMGWWGWYRSIRR